MAATGWALFFPLIATIHGLVQVLRRDRSKEETPLRSIEDETERLLHSPIFEGE